MSLAAPKPPRRFRGSPARYLALRYRLAKARRTQLDGALLVHQAALEISRAASAAEIIHATARALESAPDPCIIFQASPDGLSLQVPRAQTVVQIAIEHIETLITEGPDRGMIQTWLMDPPAQSLQDVLMEWGCKSAILAPIRKGGAIAALIMVGLESEKKYSQPALQIYATIAKIAETGLEKTEAIQGAQRPMAELEAFNFISQAVAGQTDLEKLYPVIHKAISQILGQVDLLIALYDSIQQTIHIPYLYEHPNLLAVDPFPLGQGLTSILIHSRQALLLSKDVETQAQAMGAIVLGQAPKSWLGVPLLVGEEPIGALVVQDLEREDRFSEDDRRLLTSLGAQIAVSIHNAQLIEKSHLMARRDRLLHEVTSKIRSSTDMKTILATTATELGRALHVRSATIEIGIIQDPSGKLGVINSNGDKPQPAGTDPGNKRPES
jgi:GAF domain-containing protein